jgi:hypothetical protein
MAKVSQYPNAKGVAEILKPIYISVGDRAIAIRSKGEDKLNTK